jgi:hypothetical protein
MIERQGPPVQPVEQVDADPVGAALAPTEQPSQTLLDLQAELAYFTPALLITHGHFDRDPVFEYVVQHDVPADERPLTIDCDRPFFSGLGVKQLGQPPYHEMVNWDHRLYAVPQHRWVECREFIASIAISDASRRQYTVAPWYDLRIVDPLTLASGRVLDRLPVINVIVFAASSNHGIHYLAPAIDPPRTRAYPATRPADKSVVDIASAVFQPELPR